jgi:hypothetical protein
MPICSEQDLDAKDNPLEYFFKKEQDLREVQEPKYCYPNAVFEDREGKLTFSPWQTGLTKFSIVEQTRLRDLGSPIAKDFVAVDPGISNSARHSLLFCYIAGINGYEKTKFFADNHETYHKGSGLEDTWADYWNNEIGMRFGTRLHRMLSSDTADYGKEFWQRYRGKAGASVSVYHAMRSDVSHVDIIDFSTFDFKKGISGNRDAIMAACERYLEGVILDQVVEWDEETKALQNVRLMNHLPSIPSRLKKQGFTPLIGADSSLSFLRPPGKYELPKAYMAGIDWLNAAPIAPDQQCIKSHVGKAKYWTTKARVLPWANGDSGLYTPSYVASKDRFQPWVQP